MVDDKIKTKKKKKRKKGEADFPDSHKDVVILVMKI